MAKDDKKLSAKEESELKALEEAEKAERATQEAARAAAASAVTEAAPPPPPPAPPAPPLQAAPQASAAPAPTPKLVGDIPVTCLKTNSNCMLGKRRYQLVKGQEILMDPSHASELASSGWVALVEVISTR